jgi:hypothetical protein
MRTVARALALTTSALLMVGLAPGQALAAVPVLSATVPANGSHINADPATISATFAGSTLATGTLSVTGPSTISCAGAVSGSTVSCTPSKVPPGAWADGAYTVAYSVTAVSSPPNSLSGQFTFTLDKTAPAVATGVQATPTPYTKADADATAPLVVTGGAEAGSTVHVSLTSTGGGSAQTGTGTSSGAGSFSIAMPNAAALPDGTLNAVVTSTDLAGNTSGSTFVGVLKDTALPTVSSTLPVDGGAMRSDTGSPVSSYTVTASEVLGSSSTVELFDDADQVSVTQTFPTPTSIRITPPSFPVGAYTVRISLVDAVGNAATPVTRTFSIDDTAPAAPVLSTLTNPVNAANKAVVVAAGTAEEGSSVTVTVTDGTATATGTGTTDGNGAFSVTGINTTSLADGALSATATATDAAGNTGLASAAASSVKDTVLPTLSGVAFNLTTYSAATVTSAHVTGVVGDGAGGHEADAVSVSVDDTDPATAAVLGTAIATLATGAFDVTLDLHTLSDTPLTATVHATDAQSNPSANATATAGKDVAAPVQPSVAMTHPVNAANQSAVVVSGTTEAGATVDVSVDDSVVGSPVVATVTANGSGAYTTTVNVTALLDGVLTATVHATDAPGNTSTAGTATSTKDVVAPGQPTLVVPIYVTPGTTTSVPVHGTGEPSASVTVTAHDPGSAHTATSTVAIDADGDWSTTLDTSAFGEGTVSYSAVVTDPSGNAGAAQAGSSTKDTVAPGTPATLSTSPTAYRYANKDDAITVSGTTAAGDSSASGLSAVVTISDGNLVTTDLVKTVSVASGAFSTVVSAAEMATQTDGTLTVSAVVVDAAGNAGPARSVSLVKDTTKLALVSSTPADASRVQPDSTVAKAFNEALNQATSTLVVKNKNGSTTAGTTTFSNGGKTIVFTPNTSFSENGSPYTVTVHAVDLNDSADTADPSVTSFTIDATPPAAPVLTPGSLTSPVNAGNVTAVAVSGTAETGSTVTVTLTDGTDSVTSSSTATGGAFTFSGIDVTPLADGTMSVTATATDVALNTSAASTALTATKDATTPVLTGQAFSKAHYNASDVNVAHLLGVVGDGAGGHEADHLTISIDDGDALTQPVTLPLSTVSQADGTFDLTVDVHTLTDGLLTATITATDGSGNTSSVVTATTDKDVVAPGTPGLTVSNLVNSANAAAVPFNVTTEPDATVTVTVDDSGPASPVTTHVLADGAGNFAGTLDVTSLADGLLTVTAVAADEAGNPCPTPASTTTTKDATAPAQPTVVVAGPVNATNKSAVGISGSTDANSSLTITVDDTDANTSPVTKPWQADPTSGAYATTLNLSSLTDGTLTVTVVAGDAFGNTSTGTASVAKDVVLPVISALAATRSHYGSPSSSVTGVLSEVSSVQVSASDGVRVVSQTATVAPDKSFSASLNLTTLASGPVTVTATATDTHGNVGTASTATTRDSATPPGAPTAVTAIAGDRRAVVSFSAPASNGGAAITGYTVISTPGGLTTTGAGSPLTVTGLTNGVAYTFTVRAANRVGTTSSSASSAVIPKGTSTLTLNTMPTRVVFGTYVKLSGKLVRTDTGVAAGRVLIRTRYDNGTVKTLGALTPSSTGVFSYSFRPSVNLTYSLVYAGDTKNRSASSVGRRTLVAPKITASAPTGAASSNQVVTGAVSPGKAGKVVTLYRVTSTGSLVRLASATLSSSSTYRFSVRLARGSYTLQVSIGVTPNNTSSSVRLAAKRT